MPFQVSPGVNVTEIDLTTIVPAVSTTDTALAGHFRWGPVEERSLISSEEELVQVFGKPDGTNFETFFTAAAFLSYSNKLFVVRTTEASNTTHGPRNATALQTTADHGTVNVNSGLVDGGTADRANTSHTIQIKSEDAYDNEVTLPSKAAFLAKYPGTLGNSLKVSVCDSSDAFESTVANTIAGLDSAHLIANVGLKTLTVEIKSTKSGDTRTDFTTAEARLAINTVSNTVSSFALGDLVRVGNTSVGFQVMKVAAKSATTNTAALHSNNTHTQYTAQATLTFESKYTLSTNVTANLQSEGIIRRWEFFNQFEKAPGTSDYANNVANNADASDELHICVIDEDGDINGVRGQVIEAFGALSRATDAKNESGESTYFKDVISNQSKWLWCGGATIRPASETNNTTATYVNTAVNMVNNAISNTTVLTRSMILGSDGGSANDLVHTTTGGSSWGEANLAIGQITAGYDKFKNAEEFDISLILQGKARGGTHGEQLGNYIIDNICESRKDCVAFISPAKADLVNNFNQESANTVDFRNALTSSSYAVMDGGYKYAYDKYNDVYRYVPYNGDIAGLAARTDETRDPWYSPAGFNRGILKNVVKNVYNPDKADRDILYKNGVNPIVTFPGQGTILFGDKTLLAKPSAFDRINVRRLFIVLEKAISTAAKFTLFEFNDEFTRAQFRNLVEPFLRDVQGRRGIFDFKVVCDETNNTGEVIDRNEFIGDIYNKPARSINFIQLNFVAVRTGVEFSEVVGQF